MVMAMAVRNPARPLMPHSMTHSAAICAAMAPMVMAKLIPIPAMIGMIRARTIKEFRLKRPNSSYIT